jgi:hypothetical protein
MKSLVFDTGTIISLVMNNLLWTLKYLKKQYKGDFLMTISVKKELIDRPMKSKKFKLEALVIQDYLFEGVFKLVDNKEVQNKSNYLLKLANNIFLVRNKPIKIIQKAEMEALAIVIHNKSDALVVDERTLRLLVENPKNLAKLLEYRLHTKVKINEKALNEFKKNVVNVNILRSTELAVVAYDMGILDRFITANKKVYNEFRSTLLEGALWGLKLRGCAISSDEIKEIMKIKGF